MLCAFFLLSFVCSTKQQDILGRWYLQRMTLNDNAIMDRSDTAWCMKWSLRNMRKLRPDYSISDSMRVVADVRNGRSAVDSIFIEFSPDGKVIKRELTREAYSLAEEPDTASYTLDEQTGIVSLGSGTRSDKATLCVRGGVLTMKFDFGEVVMVGEWRRK